jgi:hypothetical protein
VSASQRAKGIRGENEAYALLADQLGDCVQKRDLSQTRDGGGDIRIPQARVLVEVKRVQARSVPRWMAQARKSAQLAELATYELGKLPATWDWVGVVMWRRNGGPWQVFMPVGLGLGTPGYREVTVPEFCDWVRGRLG